MKKGKKEESVTAPWGNIRSPNNTKTQREGEREETLADVVLWKDQKISMTSGEEYQPSRNQKKFCGIREEIPTFGEWQTLGDRGAFPKWLVDWLATSTAAFAQMDEALGQEKSVADTVRALPEMLADVALPQEGRELCQHLD